MKTTTILISVLAILSACNNGRSTISSAPLSTEKIKVADQGVNIVYDDSKTGDTTLLFIHGWGINRGYWADQAAHFSGKYRVVTLDLPGFGESGKNRKSWAVADFARDVNSLMGALALKHVILVGHSMSGAIALETALTDTGRVIAVVGIDNFKNVGTAETAQEEKEKADFYKAARMDYKNTVNKFAAILFSSSTDSLVRRRVMSDIDHSDPTIAIDCLEGSDAYSIDAKLPQLKKTLYLINSDYIPTDTSGFLKNKIDYSLFRMGVTGHYPMIEDPKEFDRLLQQVIDKVGRR